MRKGPTIIDVAERAGVSRGTVDRVINGRGYVYKPVHERVLKAIDELGYMSPREKHLQAMAEAGYAPPLEKCRQAMTQETFPPLTLGVLLPNWTDSFHPGVLQGIEEARRELNTYQVKIIINECQSDDPLEADRLIDNLLSRGAKGLAVCAINDALIESKVNVLAGKRIPVITFNSDLPNSKRIAFVGQNYRKSGRIAAELLGKYIPKTGSVLAMCGSLKYDGHRERIEGFKQRMRELRFPPDQIEVVETHNDYHTTYRMVTEALKEKPDLAAVYMANQSVLGCAQALDAAEKTGKVRVVVHDMSDSTRMLLQSGRIDFTISQDFCRQGYLPLKCLRERIHLRKRPEADLTDAPISVICSQNID